MNGYPIHLEDAAAFFGGNRPPALPADTPAPDWDVLVDRAVALDGSRHPVAAVREILVREHRRLGAADSLTARLAAIGPDTVYVVAGQQAGLFGGPLYTLYKALHAIRLAERLSEATGRPVLPLFWVASDDHDLDEIRHHTIRGATTPAIIDYLPGGTEPGTPVSGLVLDDGIAGAVDRLAASLPPGDRADALHALIAACWHPGDRWADAFSRQILRLPGLDGLAVIDPAWPGMKALFRDVFRAEIAEPGRSTAILNEAADSADTSRERRRALRRPEGATNLFLLEGGRREAVYVDGDGFRAGEARFTAGEFAALIETEPDRVSPAAALRPLCQDAALPVAATIAGPGERIYLSQAAALYDMFGISRSILWPRASFTVVEPRILRTADKEGLDPAALFLDPARLLKELATESLPPDTAAAFDTLTAAVRDGFDNLARAVRAIDPTLGVTVDSEAGKSLHGIDRLRDKAARASNAADERLSDRLRAASAFLLPEGGPQERRYGIDAIWSFLGPEGIAALRILSSPGEERHRIVLPGNAPAG